MAARLAGRTAFVRGEVRAVDGGFLAAGMVFDPAPAASPGA
jgi:hypothetical protein